jgi:WD40 repeat protein
MLKVEKILSLSSPPEEDYDSLRHQRKSGTCERILSNGTFAHWTSQSSSSGVLWIHALPGSGKSVQSSYLIDHYTQSGHPCAYFFFKYNDSTKRSANSLLRSLIFQIARDVPAFHKVISQMSDDGLRLEKTDANTIWQQIFVSVLFKVDLSRPLYWVIDALDEAESTNTILKLLSDVSSSKTPIRVLIASRQTPAIATAFDRIAADIQVTPICTDDNSYDINLYATREIEYMHGTAEFRQEIVNRLVERAGGSFLWTHLALREIMQCHIEDDIKQALDDIPSGMESMYRRMETVITQLARDSDKTLAKLILTWATYSRRPVTATELSRALQPEISSVTDMKRTINEVCGQFVMIDSNNRISLIHHTAREYLTKSSELPFPFTSDDAHEYLLHKTLSVFIDRHVRSHLSQKTLPPFYAYAATSWAFHLKHCSAGSNASLDILANFFQGAHVLPWIQALAVIGELRVLVFTSRILTTVVQKHRRIDKSRSPLLHRLSDLELLELWSIDLLKVVGKFGANLRQVPTAIYSCIPQFCPLNSVLHQQFGKPSSSPVSVTGLSNADWDDCLARVSVGNEHPAEKITCSGRYVAVLNSAGTIALWDSLTFEEVQTFSHNEHVFTICFSGGGDRLASYGYLTTKIWSISTGQLLDIATNPTKARALCMTFADDDKILLMGSDLRKVRKLLLSCVAEGWQILDPSIMHEETALEGTFLNSPTSLAFNSNATQIAVAYRGFPLSVWDLSNPRMVSRCKRRQNHGRKMSNAWTGVNRVIWHPNSGDVLGIYTDGAVFKWHPLDGTHVELVGDFGDSPSEIQCSADGAVFATSDVNGTVRLFDFEHFALIYQLSSEDIVTALCFGPDGRRFYDLRASYINVWEPNALVRLSDSDDLASDVDTEARSSTMSYLASEAWADTSVQITACSARPQGGLVCIGNDDGIVELYEIDDQKKVEVARSSMGMNIEHVAWDEDGNHMVFLELGGKVTLNRVEFMPESKGGSRTRWRTVVSFKLSAETGQVHQLLLGPGSDYLLVASSYGGQLWSPKTKSLLASCTSAAPGILQKWVIHPSKRGQILALTPTTITAYSWDTLKELGRWHISCPDLPSGKTAIENLGLPMKDFTGKSPSPEGEDQLIEHAMVTEGGRLILVQISQPGLARRRQSRVLVIEEATLTSGEIGSVEPCIVPHDIASIIEKPLGVLQKDKLVFLDSSFWVCTWRLGSADLQNTLPTRHFFLPRDWVNAESLKLCEIMADGTFLCPRKGEVAVVRSELGSDW